MAGTLYTKYLNAFSWDKNLSISFQNKLTCVIKGPIDKSLVYVADLHRAVDQGPLLLTWFNFNRSMDK